MKRIVLVPTGMTLTALLAFLVLEDSGRDHLVAGLLDPILGLNHFLVLAGVGLWAGRWGGRAQWLLPSAFLLGTPVGYLLATGQAPPPLIDALVHILIVGSLLLIAGALTLSIRLPTREAASTVAVFGGCHGYVHGLEAGRAMPVWFGFGSLTSAVVLLALGVLVGLAATRTGPSP
jgi:urease accessory protein